MLTSAQRQWLQTLGGGAAVKAEVAAPAVADKKQFIARVEAARRNAFAALDRYQEQKKVEADQSVIAALSRAAKEVTTLGAFEDPGPALDRILREFRSCAASAVAALQGGDLATADASCAKLEAMAADAGKLAYDYGEGLIDGAETAKTTVKVIDTGAKVVGGVALTVATGGAAAGVVAAEVVGTATAVSVAGGVAASTAGAVTTMALGQKVDWGLFSIDILVQGLLARFGGELTSGIAAAVAKRLGPAAATLGGAVIKNAAAQVVMHIDTTLAKQALEVAYGKLIGQDVTLKEVYDACIAQLTDPSSLLVIAATSAAQGHVDVKVAAASASSPKATTTEPAAPVPTPAPAPEAAPPATKAQPIGDASATLAERLPAGGGEPSPSNPRVTAHAGGEGEAFQLELKPQARPPEVVRVRRGAAPKNTPEPATKRSSRPQEPPAEAATAENPMVDPDDRRLLGGRDENDSPRNPREAAEADADRAEAGLTERQETAVPKGAPPKPIELAPATERLSWLRQRLRLHVDKAIERYANEAELTPAQEAALLDNPNLLPAFRGSRIDEMAKSLIMQDPELADVITAPDFFAEPDILSASLPEWFDITTRGAWLDHLRTYQLRYGPRAEPLFTR